MVIVLLLEKRNDFLQLVKHVGCYGSESRLLECSYLTNDIQSDCDDVVQCILLGRLVKYRGSITPIVFIPEPPLCTGTKYSGAGSLENLDFIYCTYS